SHLALVRSSNNLSGVLRASSSLLVHSLNGLPFDASICLRSTSKPASLADSEAALTIGALSRRVKPLGRGHCKRSDTFGNSQPAAHPPGATGITIPCGKR